jgi:hypothetical protein
MSGRYKGRHHEIIRDHRAGGWVAVGDSSVCAERGGRGADQDVCRCLQQRRHGGGHGDARIDRRDDYGRIAALSLDRRDIVHRLGASFAKDAAAKGLTDPSVSIGAPTRELIDGDALM